MQIVSYSLNCLFIFLIVSLSRSSSKVLSTSSESKYPCLFSDLSTSIFIFFFFAIMYDDSYGFFYRCLLSGWEYSFIYLLYSVFMKSVAFLPNASLMSVEIIIYFLFFILPIWHWLIFICWSDLVFLEWISLGHDM